MNTVSKVAKNRSVARPLRRNVSILNPQPFKEGVDQKVFSPCVRVRRPAGAGGFMHGFPLAGDGTHRGAEVLRWGGASGRLEPICVRVMIRFRQGATTTKAVP
jgi:hypothetical protein